MKKLTAAVAQVSADLASEKEQKKKWHVEEAKKKSEKVTQKKQKQQAKREAMPVVLNIMKAFENCEIDCTEGNLSKLTAKQLRSILVHYFHFNKGLQKMSEANHSAKVAELYSKHGAQDHDVDMAVDSSNDKNRFN